MYYKVVIEVGIKYAHQKCIDAIYVASQIEVIQLFSSQGLNILNRIDSYDKLDNMQDDIDCNNYNQFIKWELPTVAIVSMCSMIIVSNDQKSKALMSIC